MIQSRWDGNRIRTANGVEKIVNHKAVIIESEDWP
jgi:hypothetical protein